MGLRTEYGRVNLRVSRQRCVAGAGLGQLPQTSISKLFRSAAERASVGIGLGTNGRVVGRQGWGAGASSDLDRARWQSGSARQTPHVMPFRAPSVREIVF